MYLQTPGAPKTPRSPRTPRTPKLTQVPRFYPVSEKKVDVESKVIVPSVATTSTTSVAAAGVSAMPSKTLSTTATQAKKGGVVAEKNRKQQYVKCIYSSFNAL